MLVSSRMTFHTVLEIGDTLVQMLRAYFRFIVLMTAIASVGCKTGGMTGGAGDHSALAVIQWEGMLSIERGGSPRCGGVAGSAIGAEQTRVEHRVGMAGYARSGCARKLRIDVALLAIDLLVRARQREVAARVVEGRSLPIRRGVACGAVRAELSAMLIVLCVAGIAIRRSALIDIVLMAIFAIRLGVFPLQFERGQVVVELGG